jgi:hypothetical protein
MQYSACWSRRGGGVAIFARTQLQSSEWQFSADDRTYELHWIRIGDVFVAALYHPPKPLYSAQALLSYIEACLDEIGRDFPAAHIVLAGDMNQLPDLDLVERTGLIQIVQQPTRGANVLDKVYVSNLQLYTTVRVVMSIVKSDHKAVVLYSDQNRYVRSKIKTQYTFRQKTPAQHALFLQHVSNISFNNPFRTVSSVPSVNTQAEFDYFYTASLDLLNQFYPQRTITVTSRDPEYVTAEIKSKLRRKNRLMRAGRVEEAGALSVRIRKEMMRNSRMRLCKIGGRADAKDMWEAVRRITGRQQGIAAVDGITAESLNDYYAANSTDPDYKPPIYKQSVISCQPDYLTEYQVFKILDKLKSTATGLDGLPAWFLRLGAPVFCEPIARLFNLSLTTSTVPIQWKLASIKPLPKVSAPKHHADFRPISITPVLTRVMERFVVQRFLYPLFLSPPPMLTFTDQFAFRPTGSPTAAIITLLSTITNMLLTNPFVLVISLDFSKAFDTVRHSTLLEKMAHLDIPINAYNWLVDFFKEHSHCTVYRGEVSMMKGITASIIQGSAVGPAAYVVNAGDLRTVNPENKMIKFADDTYLIIAASNIDSRDVEFNNVEEWAQANNLTLNRNKTKEIVFVDKKKKCPVKSPLEMPGIERVASIKVLGVILTNGLSASEHVRCIVNSSAQTLHALRVLRAHGMCDVALQAIFKSVVIAKLLYASSAWWGFATAADRQRIDGFLRRCKRSGFCPQDLPLFEKQCEAADENLFSKVRLNESNVLFGLLPPPSTASQNYQLRPRAHNRQLPEHPGRLIDSNFITRMLYKNIY